MKAYLTLSKTIKQEAVKFNKMNIDLYDVYLTVVVGPPASTAFDLI
jgi:hypothetical protein